MTVSNRRMGLILTACVVLTLAWGARVLAQVMMPESLRVAIGFVLFVLPGGTLAYAIHGGKRWSWLRFFVIGLPISIGLIGGIGIVARTLHWTIYHMTTIWYGLSVLGVIAVVLQVELRGLGQMLKGINSQRWVLLGTAITMMMLFSLNAPYTQKTSNDILLHNAEITQHASGEPLTWEEIYFDTGNPISDRISVAYWRVSESLIVHVSGVHILRAQLTISALLMLFLGGAIYLSARLFNFSVNQGLLVTTLYFLLLASGVSAQSEIILRLIQDKILAGFGISPVIFGLAYVYFQLPSWRRLAMLGLVILGTIFTHPILAGFSVSVLGGWIVLNVLFQRRLRPYIWVLLLCGVLFLPVIALRATTEMDFNFGDGEIEVENPDRIWINEEGTLYAVNINTVEPIVLLLLVSVAVLSLARVHRQDSDRFFVAVLVVLLIAFIPYTSWIYGRIVSVPHIYRVTWIIPYGLAMAYVFSIVSGRALKVISSTVQRFVVSFGLVMLVAVVGWSVARSEAPNRDASFQLHHDLLAVGQYLEATHDTRVVVMGDEAERLHDYLKTTSHIIEPVMFCEERCLVNFTSIHPDEAQQRIRANQIFFYEHSTDAERFKKLNDYAVEYVLYDHQDNRYYMDVFFDTYADNFDEVYQTSTLTLYAYLPNGG